MRERECDRAATAEEARITASRARFAVVEASYEHLPVVTEPESFQYAFGPFLLDTRERRLLRDGVAVPLTLRAFDLLQALVQNQGHLLSKDELMRRVWPDAVVEENNLTVTISALRKALDEGPTDRQYIETVPRRGYRFVADFRAVPPPAPPIDAAPRSRALRSRALTVGAIVLAGVATATVALWKRSTSGSPVRSMAVLPFRSLTNDGEYLGLGMADALITRLSATKQLSVRSTGAVQRYAMAGLDPVVAGRELQVDAVLEGSIQTAGERLRTTVRLLYVSDGSTLWSATFDERMTDIFAVQDQVSQRVADALALQLTDAQRSLLTRRDTSDSEAYELYLRGRFFWNKRSREGFERGASYFRQAVEKDPSYALAYSGLADSHIGTAFYHYAAPQAVMPLARTAALKALEIDPSLAAAHTSLAHLSANYEWDWGESERLSRRAIALEPGYATAHQWFGIHCLAPMGRLEEAIAETRSARQLEPLSAVFNAFVGATLFFARRYDEAIEEFRRTIEIHPDFGVAHWYLGRAHLQKGRHQEALAELREAVKLSGGSPLMKGTLGVGYALAGDRAAAKATLAELETLRAESYASALDIADIHAALGDREQAFRWLDRAEAERSFHLIYLKVWPELDPLRADPRFEALILRLGLKP
jgi:DNA-binding winged helix-turn-helix (wHTH) protein/TolB-like protein/tetratricopeptide (TPR) repeat protein